MRGALVVAALALAASVASAQLRTDWDGVFTAAQATRGGALYAERCANCHGTDLGGDGNGVTPPLLGPEFSANWDGLSLARLLERVRFDSAQPPAQPLALRQQVDVLAFLLSANGKPPGSDEIPANQDAVAQIRFAALRPAR